MLSAPPGAGNRARATVPRIHGSHVLETTRKGAAMKGLSLPVSHRPSIARAGRLENWARQKMSISLAETLL